MELSTIQEIVEANPGNKTKVKDLLAMEQFKPKAKKEAKQEND